jgi:hypothetical protein
LQVEVTELFAKQYRRSRDKARVRNAARKLKIEIDSNPNWLTGVKRLQNCAIPRTFRFHVTQQQGGERMIGSYLPPLRLLDVGVHDEAYERWNSGKTKPSIQSSRADSLASSPDWLVEIFTA